MTREGPLALTPEAIDASVQEARRRREADALRRTRLTWALPSVVSLVWLVGVSAAGLWGRVLESWELSLTMVFASFAGGALPQVGSGAIAFPVLTKLLDVPAEVARSFALSIQAVGVGAASAAVIIRRRPIDWRVVSICSVTGVVGMLIGAYALGDGDEPFRPLVIAGSYVRVSFTILLGASAFLAYLGMKERIREVHLRIPGMHARHLFALVPGGVLGGLLSAMVGSGAGVVVYLFVVLLFGLDPRAGIPTSLVVMWLVSVAGLVIYGVVEGHLFVSLTSGGESVTAVGGEDVANLAADRYDVAGFWLAAVPIVAWGAPLGAYVASRTRVRHLVLFAIGLALVEVVSTAVLLDDLHTSLALLAYALVGFVVVLSILYLLVRYREAIFRLASFDASRPMTRSRIEVAPDFADDLRGPG